MEIIGNKKIFVFVRKMLHWPAVYAKEKLYLCPRYLYDDVLRC